MSESQILDGLRSHDPAAFRRFCDHHLSSLWRYVNSKLPADLHIAEDIVSETIMAWIRTIDDGLPIESPNAWLRTVARNKINDHFRAAARVRQLIEKTGRMTPATNDQDPAHAIQSEELREEVRTAMDQLTDQHRLALEWKYLDRLSVRVIAERIDVTEKAAESILFRARKELRRLLQTPAESLRDSSMSCDSKSSVPQALPSGCDLPSADDRRDASGPASPRTSSPSNSSPSPAE